jgi:hypothetical protein
MEICDRIRKGLMAYIMEGDHSVYLGRKHRDIIQRRGAQDITCAGYMEVYGADDMHFISWNGTSGLPTPTREMERMIADAVKEALCLIK